MAAAPCREPSVTAGVGGAAGCGRLRGSGMRGRRWLPTARVRPGHVAWLGGAGVSGRGAGRGRRRGFAPGSGIPAPFCGGGVERARAAFARAAPAPLLSAAHRAFRACRAGTTCVGLAGWAAWSGPSSAVVGATADAPARVAAAIAGGPAGSRVDEARLGAAGCGDARSSGARGGLTPSPRIPNAARFPGAVSLGGGIQRIAALGSRMPAPAEACCATTAAPPVPAASTTGKATLAALPAAPTERAAPAPRRRRATGKNTRPGRRSAIPPRRCLTLSRARWRVAVTALSVMPSSSAISS